MKKFFVFFMISFIISACSGCSFKSEMVPTITKNPNSKYEQTFNDLDLGVLFDFNINIPKADKRKVTLWVERYNKGDKKSQPLKQLSFNYNKERIIKGHLGFVMLNSNSNDPLVFLYGPGVKTIISQIDEISDVDSLISWDYAIGKEKVKLKLGDTKILAGYRVSNNNSIRTVDFQDEESVKRIIKKDETVILLKIKIE